MFLLLISTIQIKKQDQGLGLGKNHSIYHILGFYLNLILFVRLQKDIIKNLDKNA
jgi:hypothetical protein